MPRNNVELTICYRTKDFKELMETQLNTQECPLDASLEKVLPGVHQWHRINNQEMTMIKRSMNELGDRVAQGFMDIQLALQGTKDETMQQLANTLVSASALLLTRPHTGTTGTAFSTTGVAPRGHSVEGTATDSEQRVSTTVNDVSPIDPAELHGRFRMRPKHENLLCLIREWYGTDEFFDDFGGIEGRNKKHGNKWKKRCNIHPMHFSRTQRTVKAVLQYAQNHNTTKEEAAMELDTYYQLADRSVGKFVLWAQSEGLIVTREKRGRAKQH
jgi:hypothetical protein